MTEEEDVIVLDDFEQVKREVEELKKEKARAEGALAQVRKQVWEEFRVKSGADLKRKVAELSQEELAVAKEWNEKYAAWKKKWAHVLRRRKDQ